MQLVAAECARLCCPASPSAGFDWRGQASLPAAAPTVAPTSGPTSSSAGEAPRPGFDVTALTRELHSMERNVKAARMR